MHVKNVSHFTSQGFLGGCSRCPQASHAAAGPGGRPLAATCTREGFTWGPLPPLNQNVTRRCVLGEPKSFACIIFARGIGKVSMKNYVRKWFFWHFYCGNLYFIKCKYHKLIPQVNFYICKRTGQERVFLAPESSLMPSPSHSPQEHHFQHPKFILPILEFVKIESNLSTLEMSKTVENFYNNLFEPNRGHTWKQDTNRLRKTPLRAAGRSPSLRWELRRDVGKVEEGRRKQGGWGWTVGCTCLLRKQGVSKVY